jgi:glycosyltransferase involved in cell wall biosynthesis
MFQYAYRCLSVSHYMTQAMLKLGADPQRIVYNPYGAREYFFDVQPDYRPTLIAVGRFADIKAPYLTLAAFQLIAKDNPDARLVMVGDGPLRMQLERQAQGIDNTVVFHGRISERDKLALLRDSDLLVLPGDRSNEAFGIVQLEAMACGVPALAFDLRRSGMAWVCGLKSILGMPQLIREDLAGVIDLFVQDNQLLAASSLASERRYWDIFSRQRWKERMDALDL